MTKPGEIVKLYNLPRDEDIEIETGAETIIFGHLDGMYSYCWLKGEPDKVVHLNASTPLEMVTPRRYKVADEA